MMETIAMRDAYGAALAELGSELPNLVVLDADVAGSSKSSLFGAKFPERFFNVGIAEANMAGMAAGLALKGKLPFVHCFAAFMMLRAGDPIRSLACYQNLPVKFCGTYAGLSDSYDGASHHAISDISFFRALPNMKVISPADGEETRRAVRFAAGLAGPVYLRISRAEVPKSLFGAGYEFEYGKGYVAREGSDLTLVATGFMNVQALRAGELLAKEGIRARIVNIHTIKPIDASLIAKCARETGAVVTCEEHNVIGGLGAAVAEVLGRESPVPLEILGIEDCFAESGDYGKLLEKYGLSPDRIVEKAKRVLSRKKGK
ncbi:MAG: transketolase family protein [Planctomycetota bacterium]|jgi:transketolase|nr:transketolase family protein [Planctomycetota bacterium]MDR1520123.1 transketolase family protein [Planctomycetota bacterium]